MDNSFYSMDVSFGWLLLIFIVAIFLSALLYTKKTTPWHRNISFLLGTLRFFALLLVGILLINPTLRLSTNETEEPVILIGVDNSSSIKMRMDSTSLKKVRNNISSIKQQLENEYEVETYNLDGIAGDSIAFDHPSSNLSSLFKNFNNLYEGRNVGAIIFLSDGIYNEGLSPEFLNYRNPVYTVGLSDTIPPRDVLIASVKNNRIAYQGNQFPIIVEVEQHGFDNQQAIVSIRESGKELATRNITLSKQLSSIQFELTAEKAGLKHLIINIKSPGGESTLENNHKDIYVDVIEGKEKILIVSPSPHPDISAIRDVLQASGNYESVVYIPEITEKPQEKEYDVIIEMMAFKEPMMYDFKANGKWYILSTGSKVAEVNRKIPFLNIHQRANQHDVVRPIVNRDFRKFEIKDELQSHADNFPPVEVFFGEYRLSGPTEVLLFQKVGSVATSRPFMIFYDDGSEKTAVTLGNGIWQWKLQEAAAYDQPALFKEMVLKTIQFLSLRTNKDRFIVLPRQNVYNEGERIFLETQVYDEIFERTYGNKISLSITNESDEQRNYQLIDSPINSAFNIGSLPQGIYQYEANVNLDNQMMYDNGEFLVQSLQVEALDLTANHHLLRQIAVKSSGAFFHFTEMDALSQALESTHFKDIIRTRQAYFPLIKTLWLIYIIMGLLITEWFLRKYLGMY